MKLTTHSLARMWDSARRWDVDQDFYDPMHNYLVHAYDPGSFFTALLANDAFAAISRSHPHNQMDYLKSLVGWMADSFPHESYGSYNAIRVWRSMASSERRQRLEQCKLIHTEQDEILLILKGDNVMRAPV